MAALDDPELSVVHPIPRARDVKRAAESWGGHNRRTVGPVAVVKSRWAVTEPSQLLVAVAPKRTCGALRQAYAFEDTRALLAAHAGFTVIAALRRVSCARWPRP